MEHMDMEQSTEFINQSGMLMVQPQPSQETLKQDVSGMLMVQPQPSQETLKQDVTVQQG